MPSIPWTPTKADLDGATAHTQAVLDNPDPLACYQAAAFEEAMHTAFLARPGADAQLQAEAQLEAEAQS